MLSAENLAIDSSNNIGRPAVRVTTTRPKTGSTLKGKKDGDFVGDLEKKGNELVEEYVEKRRETKSEIKSAPIIRSRGKHNYIMVLKLKKG